MSRLLTQEARSREAQSAASNSQLPSAHSSPSLVTATSVQSSMSLQQKSVQTEGSESAVQRAQLKRKYAASSSTDNEHSVIARTIQLPMLADEEPNILAMHKYLQHSSSFSYSPSSSSSEFVPQSPFFCVSKSLFSLSDESRDRGSAKIASITVQLKHSAFVSSSSSSSSSSSRSSSSASSNGRSYVSSFKIDGRKSFSNAPFKKYYHRGIHAAWFAELATVQSAAASASASSNAETSSPSNGRVLMFLSQRSGRPNGKGFTGLRHDPSTLTPKHPLLCLASNSVEYYVSVFINGSNSFLFEGEREGEPSAAADFDWKEVEVEVSARFEAGEVTLNPLSIPYAHNSAAVAPAAAAAAAAAASSSSSAAPRKFVHVRRLTPTNLPSSVSVASLSSAASNSSTPVIIEHSPSTVTEQSSSPMVDSEDEGRSTPVHSDDHDSMSEEEYAVELTHGLDESSRIELPDTEHLLQEASWPASFPVQEQQQQQQDEPRNFIKTEEPTFVIKTEEQQFSRAEMHSALMLPLLSQIEHMEHHGAPLASPAALAEEEIRSPFSSNKRTKLSIDQHAAAHAAFTSVHSEPLFPAFIDWNASSPQMMSQVVLHQIGSYPACSPVPESNQYLSY